MLLERKEKTSSIELACEEILELFSLSLQDKPESFEMLYSGSPIEALQRVSEVLSDYWELVTKSDAPLDWRCQHEYMESFGSTTDLSTEPSTKYFTGENLHLLERKSVGSNTSLDIFLRKKKNNQKPKRQQHFSSNRKLWEKIGKVVAQKPRPRLVQAGLHHRLRLRRAAVHPHSLLPHHTKGTRASAALSPQI